MSQILFIILGVLSSIQVSLRRIRNNFKVMDDEQHLNLISQYSICCLLSLVCTYLNNHYYFRKDLNIEKYLYFVNIRINDFTYKFTRSRWRLITSPNERRVGILIISTVLIIRFPEVSLTMWAQLSVSNTYKDSLIVICSPT